jgi:probable HAF family extracellular repeat protein
MIPFIFHCLPIFISFEQNPTRTMPKTIQLSVVLLLFGVSNAIGDVQYKMTDIGLGNLEGSTPFAYDINNNGQIVGDANTRDSRAFLFSNGSLQYIGTLGGTHSAAYSINDNGQIVGSSSLSGNRDSHCFLYSGNGPLQDLGDYFFRGINNSGQIAGAYSTADLANHAILYSDGNIKELGSLNGTNNSSAICINNNGQVAGLSRINDNHDIHAFLYSGDGPMQDLGTLGGTDSDAWGINDSGQVVGWSYTSDGLQNCHAFLYSGDGPMQDLGTFGGVRSLAVDINNVGQVVGLAMTSNNDWHAFLYSGNGPLQDLNDLIDPSPEWTLEESSAINDKGQIVCTGVNPNGQKHIFLLTPIPEPSTLILLSIGVMSFLFFKRK